MASKRTGRYKTRYDHKIGCGCPSCRQIDGPNWYSESGEWMRTINLCLAEKPPRFNEEDEDFDLPVYDDVDEGFDLFDQICHTSGLQ